MQLIAPIENFSDIIPVKTLRSRFEDADYLNIMCHEIGTPLTAIVGLSHILTDVNCRRKKKLECAKMLRDSSTMLMELMKNMLDYSRMDAGMIEMENIRFDLVKLVQEAVHIVAIKAVEKGLDLHVNMGEELPSHWTGDPLRIRQILLNLLSNAVKFTEKGNVSLYVHTKIDMHENTQLCITVADTGIGMNDVEVKKIFGKYVQAHSGINRKYGGTGLGLAISQNLAHLMHGDIVVKSWPGMGSHFVVILPLQKSMALLTAA